MSKEYDTPSETETSDTLSSQRIYTPTSGMTGSGSTVSADEHQDVEAIPEHIPLLFDQPPNYADAACGDDEKSSLPLSEVSAKEVEAGNNKDGKDSLPGPVRGVGCRRGRFRRSRFRLCHPGTTTTVKPTREITVDNGHQSLWGKYPLFDQLSLSTTSGNIGVTVIPQPADPANPDEPARLRIRSESGSITVAFSSPEAARLPELQMAIEMAELDSEMSVDRDNDDETHVQRRSRRSRKQKDCKGKTRNKNKCKCKCKNKSKNRKYCNKHKDTPDKLTQDLPSRPYIIDIETQSGSIAGRFLFSRSINLSTNGGSITANLIPLVYSNETIHSQNVSIQTQTKAGSQQVCLTEPIFIGNSAGSGFVDRNLYPPVPESDTSSFLYPRSSHTSKMGSMHISYPKQWAGNVHAESEGSIFLGGQGLEVKEGDGTVDGRKEAEDGPESGKWWGGKMDVSLTSEGGSILFFVG
ncbi:hypothetical protein PHISCL_01245 [Aspergillus sclerotialis]|uniref:Uncharacterized protein n=1 Tax=Aspergillus sclerotialis TaxID=2070753 RepID=A0A3A3A402_9EURO|nr:hypothetical protein PHISCL_01245 [Aspergillus sclerotialis]